MSKRLKLICITFICGLAVYAAQSHRQIGKNPVRWVGALGKGVQKKARLLSLLLHYSNRAEALRTALWEAVALGEVEEVSLLLYVAGWYAYPIDAPDPFEVIHNSYIVSGTPGSMPF